MCGICGVIDKKNEIDKSKFEKMVDIVTHRGPDDRGTYYDDCIALGHRRLSIIDLSSDGHQPFCYQDRYVIVYNGEIYNYKELRKELSEKYGYRFATETDTEVLIAMYDHYGEKCVYHLNGMWAFAIYDKQDNMLFCSRDRFGVKPFYYYVEDDRFMFSSEIKQILVMQNKNKVYANTQRLLDFLVLGDLDYTEETMFADIMQLRGGHNLYYNINKGTYQITRYYDIMDIKYKKRAYQTACHEFRTAFGNSVKLRLRADVPIGYCLSGGLDSSAIVCMANYILNKNKKKIEQKAVSSCFEDKAYDEQEYIDEVIKETGVKSCKVFPRENDLFEMVDDIIWHMDEPFGSTSIFAGWNVFKTARENGLTVMLDGQGADEQLGGYTDYYTVAFTYYLRRFRFIKFGRELYYYCKCRAQTEKYVSAKDVLLNAVVSAYIPNKLKLFIKNKLGYGYKDMPFSQNLINRVVKGRTLYRVSDPQGYVVDRMQRSMAALMHYEDRESMAFSIESRVPFLDYRLVDNVCSMPISYKIRHGMTKAVMRDGMQGILTEKVRTRVSKLGFVTPEDKWINENYDLYRKELQTACRALTGLINEQQVMQWFDNHKGKIKRQDWVVWRIICAGRWMKMFNVSLGGLDGKRA